MASVKVGAFTWTAGGTTRAITGVGFRPKLVMLFTTRSTSYDAFADVSIFSHGFGIGTGLADQWRVADWNGWVIGLPSSSTLNGTNVIAGMSDPLNSTLLTLSLSAIGDDGFTITRDFGDADNVLFSYLCIGGADVEVAVGSTAWATTTGEQTISTPGFQPDLVLLGAVYKSGDGIFSGAGATSFGWVDSGLRQCVVGRRYKTAGAPSDSNRYQHNANCIVFLKDTDGTVEGLADCSAFTTTGFTLDWSVATSNAGSFVWVALKGVSAYATSGAQPSATGAQAFTGLGIRPQAVLTQSAGLTANGADDSTRWSFGLSDATSQLGMFVGDVDGAANDGARNNVRRISNTSTIILATPTGTGTGTVNADATIGGFNSDGFTTTWTTADATARVVFYLALGSVEADFATDGNHHSGEFIGLSWVEYTHVDSSGADKTYLWAPVDLTDPSTYFGGFKEARVLSFGDINRGLSDSRGQYETAEWSWTQSDTDRLVRGLLGSSVTKNLLNRMALIRMIDDASRRQFLTPRLLVRGVVRHYEPISPLEFRFTARDFLASKFGPANLEKQIPQRLITRVDFPDCPIDTVGKPVPIIYGQLSDASSANPPPVLTGTAARGSVIDDGVRVFGFGDLTSSAAVPTGLTVTAAATGNVSTDVPDSKYGVWVTSVDSSGRETDPDCVYTNIAHNGSRGTFATPVQTDTVASNEKIQASWSAAAGASKYRAYLGWYYFGARPTQYIEVTAPTVSCEFTDSPDWQTVATTSNITSGANLINWTNAYEYAVSANYSDGETALSEVGVARWSGHRREFRVEWTAPAIAPNSYYVYRRRQLGTWDRRWTVAVGTTTFDDDNLDTNVTYINGAPQPTGAVPLTYVGVVTDILGGVWHRFLVCGHAVKEITDLFQGGARIHSGHYGTTFAVPGKTGYSTYFANTGNPQYMDILGRRYTCVMVRGIEAEHAISGKAPLTANVKGIETVGDGSGTLITSLADIYKHLVINWLFQSYQSGSWLSAPDWPTDVDGSVVSQVDETSFDTVETNHNARISGGYTGAIMFGAQGESITLREALARMNLSADCQAGFNRNSQFFISAIDYRASALTGLTSYTQLNDIVQSSFDLSPQTDQVENVVVYSFRKRYAPVEGAAEWDWKDQELRDEDAIDDLQEERRSQVLELHAVRTASVATDIASRRLDYYKDPPVEVHVTTNLKGLSTELGDLITVTHIGGISSSGWTDRTLRVMRHVTNPGNYTVRLECVDVDRLYHTLPASFPAWLAPAPPIGPTEQGYGYEYRPFSFNDTFMST